MLHGKKVVLRAAEKADVERLHAFGQDLEIYALSGFHAPVPRSLAAAEAEWEKHLEDDDGNVRMVIEVDGVVIGDCQLMFFSEDHRHCMIGITIGDREYWGKGYGEDTMRVLLDYAFDHLNMHRVQLGVFETNERAQRLYKKLGFVEEGRDRELIFKEGRYIDNIRMGILRDEWLSQRSEINP
jgi:RimJ/RimL family protein N-acetyltransferase